MLKSEDISGFTNKFLRHPFVQALLQHLSFQDEEIVKYKKRVADLEKQLAKYQKVPGKPDLGGASKLDKVGKTDKKGKKGGKRTGKRKKKANLVIHKETIVKAENVPADWVLVKHFPHIIQDAILKAENVRYKLATPIRPNIFRGLVGLLLN